jgi:hypothetical protein
MITNTNHKAEELIRAMLETGRKTGTVFLSPKQTIRATRVHKWHARDRAVSFVVTVGTPNAATRRKIKTLKFPVKGVWFTGRDK